MGERPDEVVHVDPLSGTDEFISSDDPYVAPGGQTGDVYEDGITWGATTGEFTGESGVIEYGADEPDDVASTRAQIEETRAQMSETIDAIQSKLDPGNLADQAKQSVRNATVGKAEHMVEEAGDSVKGLGSTLIETIKENPLPAALAGVGLGWLVVRMRSGTSSQSNGKRLRGYESPYAYDAEYGGQYGYSGQYAEGADSGGISGIAGSASDLASSASDQAQSAVSGAVNQVQGTASTVADQVQNTASTVSSQAVQGTQQTIRGFSQLMQEQPLAVAAGAVALGVAAGLAIPETPQEDRLMGPAHQQVMEQAQQLARDTANKVETVAQEAVGAAKQEAKDQDLL